MRIDRNDDHIRAIAAERSERLTALLEEERRRIGAGLLAPRPPRPLDPILPEEEDPDASAAGAPSR